MSGAELKIQAGDPAARILAETHSGNYDLVVMGAHGRGAFMDMLLGSVANKVVRVSTVPVLTVRLPKESSEE